MLKESVFSTNLIDIRQNSADLKRKRLHGILRNAMDYPLIVVCAGAGYGKTRTVYSFLREYGADAIWLQLSNRDNKAAHFWENCVNVVSKPWREAGKILEEIGFPRTEGAFSKWEKMLQGAANYKGDSIFVFDDFHLLHDPDVLNFIDRTLNHISINTKAIIISRTMPKLNIIGMMMNERVFIIDEDTLCFTEDEIAAYYKQLSLHIMRQDVRNVYKDTHGWAFAVSLIGNSMAKKQKYERCALDAMKKNIFRLLESEVFLTASENLRRFLLRVSLIDHLSAVLVRELAGSDALVKEMEALNSYIRYDFNLDTYMIHHLFLDYLRQRQNILSEEEKINTWQKAGAWCAANGYQMDALSYYEKCGDYNAIALKFVPDNLQIPQELALYALEIFDKATIFDAILPSVHLKMKISLNQLEEAADIARRYIKKYETLPESRERNLAIVGIYGHWALALRNMSTHTDIYDFDILYRKMGEYCDGTEYKIFGKCTSLLPISWATPVGVSRKGAMEEYIGAVSRSIPPVSRALDGLMIGYDDLLWGELHTYRGDFETAERHLDKALKNAGRRGQHLTQNMSLVYLMLIAFCRGDLKRATELLRSAELLTEKEDYDIRFEIYDIIHGFYLLMVGQTEEIPEWLKGNFSPYAHPSFLENLGNSVKLLYYFRSSRYGELLAYIESMGGRKTILFERIELKILQSLCLYRLKPHDEAVAALTEAYNLAKPNNIITPFVVHAKDMRTLTAAALKDGTCAIPRRWLESVNRKASAFAKIRNKMVSAYRVANRIDEVVSLSNREMKVLADFSQGFSRTEIAATQNISVNTVKMIAGNVCDKLCVNTVVEAVRIAAARRII